jgi:DUF2075 family protein
LLSEVIRSFGKKKGRSRNSSLQNRRHRKDARNVNRKFCSSVFNFILVLLKLTVLLKKKIRLV